MWSKVVQKLQWQRPDLSYLGSSQAGFPRVLGAHAPRVHKGAVEVRASGCSRLGSPQTQTAQALGSSSVSTHVRRGLTPSGSGGRGRPVPGAQGRYREEEARPRADTPIREERPGRSAGGAARRHPSPGRAALACPSRPPRHRAKEEDRAEASYDDKGREPARPEPARSPPSPPSTHAPAPPGCAAPAASGPGPAGGGGGSAEGEDSGRRGARLPGPLPRRCGAARPGPSAASPAAPAPASAAAAPELPLARLARSTRRRPRRTPPPPALLAGARALFPFVSRINFIGLSFRSHRVNKQRTLPHPLAPPSWGRGGWELRRGRTCNAPEIHLPETGSGEKKRPGDGQVRKQWLTAPAPCSSAPSGSATQRCGSWAVVSSWDSGRVTPVSFFLRRSVLGEADREVGSEGP